MTGLESDGDSDVSDVGVPGTRNVLFTDQDWKVVIVYVFYVAVYVTGGSGKVQVLVGGTLDFFSTQTFLLHKQLFIKSLF